MTVLLDEAIQKIRALPRDEQDMLADVILEYTDKDSGVQLSPAQIEEIRRRLADPEPRFASLQDVSVRLSRRYA